MEALTWAILLLPLASAGIITLCTRKNREASAQISISAIVIGFLLSLVLFVNYHGTDVPVEWSAEAVLDWLTVNIELDGAVRGRTVRWIVDDRT